MKRAILFPILFSFIFLANAQEKEYQYIFQKSPEYGLKWDFFGGLTFSHLQVKTNTMPGIETGFMLNNNFLLGVYGSGTVGNFAQQYGDDYHHVMFGEGGFMAGYIANTNKTMHFGGTFKLGYVSLVADDKEMKLFNDVDPIAEDNGTVYHPELFCELNITPFMRVKLGAGYSFYLLEDESVVCNNTIDSWTMNLGIVFGNFSK